MRKQFYLTAKQQAANSVIKGYSFGDPADFNRTKAFIDLLLLHKIDVYKVPNSTNYFVPTAQDNYIMVKSIFENQITYKDSTFYDASTWSLIHAYGLPFTEVKSTIALSEKITTPLVSSNTPIIKSNYAYLVSNSDYNIHQFIYALQSEGVIVQTATRTFSTNINGENMNFGYGSIIISVQQQKIDADALYNILSKASLAANIKVHTVSTGFNKAGIDLGSNYVKTLKKPEAAMIIGNGVAASEAGEIWHLLDQRLHMPITKIDILTFSRVRLARYNTLVIVSGVYNLLDKSSVDKIKAWVQEGNTLITIKSGAEWAIKNGFTKFQLAVDSATTKGRLDYDRATEIEGAKALGGSIFTIDLDTTHPIGYGFSKRKVSVYKNNSTFFQNSTSAYNTIAQYTNTPLVGGYLHPNSLKMIKNSPSILVGAEGSGRVILFADEPNFRGTWYGTNKLFLNALFLGSIMTTPGANYSEAEEEDKH